ncbi:hypothetical protein KY290_002274 [Solanum tuberosum]|uniref:Uncharacterized protein n=1 Tax=Solanum tuberosum TaxID=4113 RepID=A0ABQ7WPK5_SOLTU|nr:hypothetical protein KY290_002274 [Solanum tuberosum]
MQDNISQCQEILSLFLPLDEVTIARIVGVIVRTQSGDKSVHSKLLADLCGNNTWDLSQMTEWDADTLIYATKQLVSSITLYIYFLMITKNFTNSAAAGS